MPIHIIDKPIHLTSHDVVARARKAWGTRRVGHGGTLDPLATGVLVLLRDEATKLSPYLSASSKRYRAWIAFGVTTPTLDAEGPALALMEASAVAARVSRADIEAALPHFLTLRAQVPPAFAAIKLGGVKGYEAARRGQALDLPARPAGYASITMVDLGPCAAMLAQHALGADTPTPLDPHAPTAVLELEVQAGTYVRAFARDLGVQLGVPAHLAGLRRTAAGHANLADATPIDNLALAPAHDPVALLGLPTVTLAADAVARVRQGQRPAGIEGRVLLLAPDGAPVAIADRVDDTTHLRVFNLPL